MKKHSCSDHYLYNRPHMHIGNHLISKGFKQGNCRKKYHMEYLHNPGAGVVISTAVQASKMLASGPVRKHQKNGTQDSMENSQGREA